MKLFLTTTLSYFLFLITLQSQTTLEPIVQFGHPGMMINEVVLSPDGEVLASTDGQYLKLWDLASGLEFKSFKSEGASPLFGGIRNISFSPDGNSISYLTSSEKVTRQVASGQIGERESAMEDEIDMEAAQENGFSEEDKEKIRNAERFRAQAYSQDQSLLAILTSQKLEIRQLPDKKVVQTIKLKDQGFQIMDSPILQISSDNQLVLIDTTVYEIEKGKDLFSISPTELRLRPTAATFSPDGKSVIFCGGVIPPEEEQEEQEAVAVYDMQAVIKRLYGIFDAVGKAIYIMDATTGDIQKTIETSSVTTCMLYPNENKLITGHYNNEINVWDLATGNITRTFSTVPDTLSDDLSLGIRAMCLTPDRKSLIIGGSGGVNVPKLSIWDFADNRPVRALGAAIPPINLEVTQSRKDSLILQEYEVLTGFIPFLSEKKLKSYRILNLTNGKVPHAFPRYDSIVFSPNLNYYLRLSREGKPVQVHRAQDNDVVASLEESSDAFSQFLFSPDGEWVAGQIRGGLYVWDSNTGKVKHNIPKGDSDFFQIVFSPASNAIGATYRDKTLRFWSLETGKVIWEDEASWIEKAGSKSKDAGENASEFAEDRMASDETPEAELKEKEGKSKAGKMFGKMKTGIGRGINKMKDKVVQGKMPPGVGGRVGGAINTLNTLNKFGGMAFTRFYDIELSDDQKYAALWRDDYASVRFMNMETGKEMRLINDLGLKAMQQMVLGSSEEMTPEERERIENDSIELKDNQEIQTAAMYKYMKESYALKNLLAISPDWTRVAKASKGFGNKEKNIKVMFTDKGRKSDDYELENSADFTEGVAFSPDGKMIAASNNSDNEIRLWDVESGKVIKTLRGHSGKVAFSASGKTMVSTGWDRQVKVWDLDTEKEIYTFIGIRGANEYIVMLPNGYYTTSRKDTRAIAFAQGRDVYPFDQFDLAFNRPDLLLKEFRSSMSSSEALEMNQNLIDAYHQAYQKRLERMNFKEDQLKKEIHVPSVEVSTLPLSSKSKQLTFSVKATDSKYKLASLHVLVNGVPAKGGQFALQSQKTQSVNRQVEIELSNGENRIQVFALNELGASSLKYYTIVNYLGTPSKPNLHLVLLGASTFKNSDLNLTYPNKDLDDLEALFREKKAFYNNIVTHRYTDQDFTTKNIETLKNKLAQTNVNDRVMIFVATHGMLSDDLSYYLATHNTDPGNPATASLSYDALDKMLAAIPARQKVLFLDACHAGEIIEAKKKALEKVSTPEGSLHFRALPSTGWEKLGSQGAFDLMKDLFVDLKTVTGATVVGSASGLELAIESSSWNNSVFTYAFKHGLKKGVADLNSDGKIHLSELRDYLGFTVARLSNNEQQPIHRSENILNDWQIW